MKKSAKAKKKFNGIIRRYKSIHGCLECRERRWWVLDFHHIDASDKDDAVTTMINNGSWKKVRVEIKKCVVLCSNCHRDFHHKEHMAL